MIEHQKRGGIPFLIPAEPFDRERAVQLGMNPDDVVLLSAESAEHNFALIDSIIQSAPGGNTPTRICWDSFSASPTKDELESDPGFESKAMGSHARLVSQQMRKLQKAIEEKNITLVVVLQSKSKIGISFGSPVTYLAEKPWFFYSHVQLEMKYIGHVKQGENDIGIRIKVLARKNKVGVPFLETEVECLFESGIDSTGPLLDVAVANRLVLVTGKGRFAMNLSDGNMYKFTRREWPDVLRENPSWVSHIKNLMQAAPPTTVAYTPVPLAEDKVDANVEPAS
jgi:recombination protein RecA